MIINFRVEENSRADRRVNKPGWFKFNFKNKKTNKESFEKKHCVATSCRGK